MLAFTQCTRDSGNAPEFGRKTHVELGKWQLDLRMPSAMISVWPTRLPPRNAWAPRGRGVTGPFGSVQRAERT